MKQQNELLEKQEEREKVSNVCEIAYIGYAYFLRRQTKMVFPFWFWGLDVGSDSFSSWYLHTFYFNYLKSEVSGDARSAIQGLTLSNENYEVAIGLLKKKIWQWAGDNRSSFQSNDQSVSS